MDGWVTIGTEIDTKKFDKQIQDVERKINDLEKELEVAENAGYSSSDIEKVNLELEKAKNKYISLRKQQEKLNQTGLPEISDITESISGKTSKILRNVGKWVLAVFSVRTAYTLVSRASSTLAQYNKQYSADLQYISYALSQMLAPVLQYLVNLAFKLLSYINYIAQAWFGINLFANAGAKNMKSMAGSAEKIKKSLQTAGFDEMNILSDTSSSGGGGAGAIAPSVDLSQMEAEIPEWVKWIAENKDAIIGFFEGLALAIASVKIFQFLNSLNLLGQGLSNADKLVKGLGIFVLLTGLAMTIKSIVSYINDQSWKNFGKIVSGIGIALAGLGAIIGSIPLAVAGGVTLIVGLIASNWEKIEGILLRSTRENR